MMASWAYWFRGWVAALMLNPRRRRTILALLTVSVILLAQSPTILSVMLSRTGRPGVEQIVQQQAKDLAQLNSYLNTGEIDNAEHNRRAKELQELLTQSIAAEQVRKKESSMRIALWVNVAFPPGWLPYGAMRSAEGNVWAGLIGAGGFAVIGSLGLWGAYSSTVRIYTGGFNNRARLAIASTPSVPSKAGMLEWNLPWISESCAAVALANFRSLMRLPEVKSALFGGLAAILIVAIAIGNLGKINISDEWRPFMALSAIAFASFLLVSIVQNQFGYDRCGFRAYVLSGANRRDILLGKNLAILPFALFLGLLVLGILQFLFPLRLSELVASLFQLFNGFLILCLLGNFSSILTPWAYAEGSFKPAHLNGVMMLSSFAFIMIYPLAFSSLVIPPALSLGARRFGLSPHLPIYFGLALIQLGIVSTTYWFGLKLQGRLLQNREAQIVQMVTEKTA